MPKYTIISHHSDKQIKTSNPNDETTHATSSPSFPLPPRPPNPHLINPNHQPPPPLSSYSILILSSGSFQTLDPMQKTKTSNALLNRTTTRLSDRPGKNPAISDRKINAWEKKRKKTTDLADEKTEVAKETDKARPGPFPRAMDLVAIRGTG